MQHAYATALEAYKDRLMRNVLVMDILVQQFKSYLEFGRSILRQLVDKIIFEMLEAGYLLPSVGDFPKYARESMLLLQGDGRHPEGTRGGPAYLGELLRACDATLWQRLVDLQGMADWEEEKILYRVGSVAMGIVQEMGPLHIKINPCKDAGEFWRTVFLGPLFFKATGKQMQANMHLRQIIGLEEALLAAWLRLRVFIMPVLLGFSARVDASAVLWFFECTLAVPTIAYDVIYKQAMPEKYVTALKYALLEAVVRQRHNYPPALFRKIDNYLYLLRSGHPLFNLLGTNCHTVDEAFGEGGVNALLHRWVRTIWCDVIARDTALRKFANRTDFGVREMVDAFVTPPTIKCPVTGRPMEEMVVFAAELIVDVLCRIVQAAGPQLPYRVPKGNARPNHDTDAWICWALTNDTTTKLYSHEVASPAFALFPGQSPDAPDGFQSLNGCNNSGCPGSRLTSSRTMLCGHAFCEDCCDLRDCPLCQRAFSTELRRMANVEKNTQQTRVIRLEELHVSAKANVADAHVGRGGDHATVHPGQDGPEDPDDMPALRTTMADLCERLLDMSPPKQPRVPLVLSPSKLKKAMDAVAAVPKVLSPTKRALVQEEAINEAAKCPRVVIKFGGNSKG
jgi:hypothetical protein